MPKTVVKDQATAEFAARNLEKGADLPGQPSEPNAPKPKSTSEKLFPEFMTDDGAVVNRPIRSYEDKAKVLPATATPVPEIPPQTQTPTPTVPTYIKPEDLAGKMVKLKVDGVETDVPAESLIKTNQLERHLNAQMMKLAEDRVRFEADRAALLRNPPPIQTKPEIKKTPEVESLESQLTEMRNNMAMLQSTLIPQIQEAGIKRVEQLAKERLGTDDFRSYFDRIKQSALDEVGKPENVANPQARQYFDSDAFYFQKYQEMKLKDLVSKPAAPVAGTPNNPALVTHAGAPVVLTNQGQPVSMPAFESSGGVPSSRSPDGDWAVNAQKLFDRAREVGTMDAWVDYYRAAKKP